MRRREIQLSLQQVGIQNTSSVIVLVCERSFNFNYKPLNLDKYNWWLFNKSFGCVNVLVEN